MRSRHHHDGLVIISDCNYRSREPFHVFMTTLLLLSLFQIINKTTNSRTKWSNPYRIRTHTTCLESNWDTLCNEYQTMTFTNIKVRD